MDNYWLYYVNIFLIIGFCASVYVLWLYPMKLLKKMAKERNLEEPKGWIQATIFLTWYAPLFYWIIKCRKIKKTQIVTEKIETPKERVILVVVIVTVVIIVGGSIFATQNNNSSNSKEILIKQIVDEIKNGRTFPEKISDDNTLSDITAESNAIRYHFIVSGVDLSILNDDDLNDVKKRTVSGICDSGLTDILNEDINIEYSYFDNTSQKTYLISATKNDCLIK